MAKVSLLLLFIVCAFSFASGPKCAHELVAADILSELDRLGLSIEDPNFHAGGQSFIMLARNSYDVPAVIKLARDNYRDMGRELEIQRELFFRASNDSVALNPFLPVLAAVGNSEGKIKALVSPLFSAGQGKKEAAMNLFEHQRDGFTRIRHIPRTVIIERIIDAVALAHKYGYVHRDLKPTNILIDDQGQVKIIDWGYAASIGQYPRGQEAGTFSGNLGYCSVNQLRRLPAEPKDDLEALRLILAWGILAFDHPEEPGFLIQRRVAIDADTGEPILRDDFRAAPELTGINRAYASALWSLLPVSTRQLKYLVEGAEFFSENTFLRRYGALMRRFYDSHGFMAAWPETPLIEEEREIIAEYLAYDLLSSRLLMQAFPDRLNLPSYMTKPILDAAFRIFEKVSSLSGPIVLTLGPHKALYFDELVKIAHRYYRKAS